MIYNDRKQNRISDLWYSQKEKQICNDVNALKGIERIFPDYFQRFKFQMVQGKNTNCSWRDQSYTWIGTTDEGKNKEKTSHVDWWLSKDASPYDEFKMIIGIFYK